jgi:hypothetical protein
VTNTFERCFVTDAALIRNREIVNFGLSVDKKSQRVTEGEKHACNYLMIQMVVFLYPNLWWRSRGHSQVKFTSLFPIFSALGFMVAS